MAIEMEQVRIMEELFEYTQRRIIFNRFWRGEIAFKEITRHRSLVIKVSRTYKNRRQKTLAVTKSAVSKKVIRIMHKFDNSFYV